MMETVKEITPATTLIDRYDTYDWYLELGPLANANGAISGALPTWNDFVRHPDYDAFWQRQAFAPLLNRVTVPTLNVAGWWDQEDFYGPLKIYELLEKHEPRAKIPRRRPMEPRRLVARTGRKLGNIDFGSDTATYFRRNVMAPWFAYYLKDQGTPPARSDDVPDRRQRVDRARCVAANEERHAAKLYFQADGKLAFTAPPRDEAEAFDTYLSDPHNPVPYRPRPITLGRGWSTWHGRGPAVRPRRPDVRSYVTDPLTEPVVVAGQIVAHLFAATSGTDSDWIVKLIDVYPEKFADETMGGYQLMVAGDVIRGRYRKSSRSPSAITPKSGRVRDSVPCQRSPFTRGTASWCRCRAPGSR